MNLAQYDSAKLRGPTANTNLSVPNTHHATLMKHKPKRTQTETMMLLA